MSDRALLLTQGRFPLAPGADAMLIRGGRIVALGREAELRSIAAAEQLDTRPLAGRLVLPGCHDCHLHLIWAGRFGITQASLVGVASIDELLQRLAEHAKQSGEWVVGFGFDQDKLREERMPSREDLDRALPGRPVLIYRICGHAAVASSAAVARLSPEQRAGGDPDAGLYTEHHIEPLRRLIPAPDDATNIRCALAAMRRCLANGITSVQTMLDQPEQMRALALLRREKGWLPVRVVGMHMERHADDLFKLGTLTEVAGGCEWLRVGAVKFFADGSLGARTALLSRPYADDPSTVGVREYEPELLKRRMRQCAEMGFQIACHAIGDAALDETLDAIEFALQGRPNTMRHRVEHASLARPDQIERLARLDVHVTLQPQFVTSDTWTGERIGPDRLPWAYPFASLIRAGVTVGLSSDAPVEKIDSNACLRAAIDRHPWAPHDALTQLQALRAYTEGSAKLAHRETFTGTLAPGMAADFVVLEATTGHLQILRETWVAGRCVHHDPRPTP